MGTVKITRPGHWNKVLWRPLWWTTATLWQLLLQHSALQQQQQRVQQQLPEPGLQQPEPGFQQPEYRAVPVRLQPHLPRPEREHTRCMPEERQHGADLVLHHRLGQQLRRPSEVQQIPKQSLVVQGVQQSRLNKNFVVRQYLNSELFA